MRGLTIQLIAALFLTAVTLVTGYAQSTDDAAGAQPFVPVAAADIEVTAGFARAMLPGQPSGGGFVTILNRGAIPDRLVATSSPAAGKVEIHSMEIKDGVMVMRPVAGGLEIPAGATVEMKPGGLHLMLMQVENPFAAGTTVPLTLEFETAGKIEIALPVRAPGQN
jgi:periplasmic copper chaperone A